ncbi:MAG: hypothetical protein JXR56_03075 [Candidatus Cloacimonetes bacterium]|nr:hypothetical protein [Candidatus Cloacimonadota bacterium]
MEKKKDMQNETELKQSAEQIDNEQDVVSEARALYLKSQDESLTTIEKMRYLKQAEEMSLKGFHIPLILVATTEEEVIIDIEKAIEQEPFRSEYYFFQDMYFFTIDEKDKAIISFSKATGLNPNDPLPYLYRSIIYCNHMHDFDKAIAEYIRLIELFPENDKYYFNLGNIYDINLEDFENAIIYYSKAIELNPLKAEYYSARGSIYEVHLQDSLKALQDYAKAIEFSPERKNALSTKGSFHKKSKEFNNYLNVIDIYQGFIEEHSDLLPNLSDESALVITESILDCYGYYSDSRENAVPFLDYRIELLIKRNDFEAANNLIALVLEGEYDWGNEGWWLEKKDLIAKLTTQIAIDNAKIEERNRMMANLSHTIKNLLGTIIDPLMNMKNGKEYEETSINNALQGTQLIRGIVNAMSMSHSGSIDDFKYDILNNEQGAKSLNNLVMDALKYSVGLMLDDKYFGKYLEKYFVTDEDLYKAEGEWAHTTNTNNINRLTDFIQKYMADIEIDIDDAEDLILGDSMGSALKMLIMIQEIILNAVKYASFVKRDSRKISIKLSKTEDNVVFIVKNSYKSISRMKTSGLGREIINSFAKLLETEPEIEMDDSIYSVTIKIKNYWRKQ